MLFPIELRAPMRSLRRFAENVFAYAGFVRDFWMFRRMALSDPRIAIRWRDRMPSLEDRAPKTPFDPHYIYHPAWAARVLAKTRPAMHVDISSTLHFCSIVSAFIPVKFYDFRPAPLKLDNLHTGKADLTRLPFPDGTIPSLSCMHVIEHVGLGRYGDLIDPDGDMKAANELRRVLAPGGTLLVAVPVGTPCIRFNSHRIYSHNQVLQLFQGLRLQGLSLITEHPEEGGFFPTASMELVDAQSYGCGCYWYTKESG